jgi:hypothetical protein
MRRSIMYVHEDKPGILSRVRAELKNLPEVVPILSSTSVVQLARFYGEEKDW